MTTDAPTHLPDGRPIPLMTGDERLMLESRLDFHRATLELKCAGLEDSQLRLAPAGPSELTLLGLVQHLAECERNWFQRVVGVEVSMRWVLIHMIEEYARHNGYADILRECIDGVTGA
ncbi:DUF664 domain-containing protein [Streptomyces sp. MS1.AVA.1]|uniref:DUF664 domain-containing protein n=1 Tax=Streptomyces machairae TaxID=3134109 RepID=A0ABU8UIQ2_9ACTN